MKSTSLPTFTLIGHRGAALEAPENTDDGFRHAISIGLGAVEFDVRLTADLQLAVIHDATVDRTTNGTGRVAELTMADLAGLDARAIHQDWPRRCPVPTLDQVLAVLAPVPELLIEIKPDTTDRLKIVARLLVDALDRAGRHHGVTIIAGQPELLTPVRSLRPSLPLGIGLDGSSESWSVGDQFGITHALIRTEIASPDLASGLRERGWAGVVGPVNDTETAIRVRDLGLSHPYSDVPSTVGPTFASR